MSRVQLGVPTAPPSLFGSVPVTPGTVNNFYCQPPPQAPASFATFTSLPSPTVAEFEQLRDKVIALDKLVNNLADQVSQQGHQIYDIDKSMEQLVLGHDDKDTEDDSEPSDLEKKVKEEDTDDDTLKESMGL